MAEHHDSVARIGPNAITRVLEAIDQSLGPDAVKVALEVAKLDKYADIRPASMVEETEVTALQTAVFSVFGKGRAREIMRAAGKATANYLIFNRIPSLFQGLVRLMPPRAGARLLLVAILKNAWTFAGSGTFEAHGWYPVTITIRNNPLARGRSADAPVCDYYTATFEQLFRRLVDPAITVEETTCEAKGDKACTFVLRWPGDGEHPWRPKTRG